MTLLLVLLYLLVGAVILYGLADRGVRTLMAHALGVIIAVVVWPLLVLGRLAASALRR